MNWGWLLFGRVRFGAELREAADILNLCMAHSLVYRGWQNDTASGQVSFEMTSLGAHRLERLCREEGIRLWVIRRGGLPLWVRKYKRRGGMVLGAVLGLLLIWSASRVLWDIRISGNETMTCRAVRAELAESGVYVGMPLSSLDIKKTEMQIALDSEYISWVSINMSGTVAYVEIRERVATPDPTPLTPANLVARCEGLVEGLEVYEGKTVVKMGQAVRKGELLVSGLYDSQAVGWRVTRSAGRVLARTEHDFSVEIPLNYERKEYIGAPFYQKTLIFFEKEIKLFKNSSILGTSCDKIVYMNALVPNGAVSLPFSIRTEKYLPYEYRAAVRDCAQAEALAYYELERQIAQALPEAALLQKSITVLLTEDSYRLSCTVRCLENIAEIREFSVGDLP